MTCKTLNPNYLLKLCLNKIFYISLFALIFFCSCLGGLSSFAEASPNIINGSAHDDSAEASCSEEELLDYVARAKKQISGKWHPVKGFENRDVVVVFTVNQDGTIENEQIVEDSGSQAINKSALEALKAASPLPSLPKGAPDSIQIRYVFSWHIGP